MISVRVGFHAGNTVAADHGILVSVICGKPRNGDLPYSCIADLLHVCGVNVPVVEIADQRNTPGVLSPYSEDMSRLAVKLCRVAAEKFIGCIV